MMHFRFRIVLPALALSLAGWLSAGGQGLAEESGQEPENTQISEIAVQTSSAQDEGLPWIENIVATYYGSSDSNCWGGYGNALHPMTDYFCALPASQDQLDCLGGALACRIERCGRAEPDLSEVLSATEGTDDQSPIELWPGAGAPWESGCAWTIEGTEGDGLFRLIQIRPAGEDGPVFEAYVGDVGPWCQDDAYWETGARPNAEDGIDSHGRVTNLAGIDISYALAQAMGCRGTLRVDWRWKTVNGAYVVARRPTEWRW